MFRVQERKEQRDCDRFHSGLLQFADQNSKLSLIKRLQHFAGSNDTLADAEPEFVNDQRRRFDCVEIVKLRTCLASDHQHIFKAFRRNERNPCSAALEQSVCADSRTVNNFDLIESRISFGADALKSLTNCE